MVKQSDKTDDEPWSYQPSFIENTVVKLFKFVNKYIAWHNLPSILGTFVSHTSVFVAGQTALTSCRISSPFATSFGQAICKMAMHPKKRKARKTQIR